MADKVDQKQTQSQKNDRAEKSLRGGSEDVSAAPEEGTGSAGKGSSVRLGEEKKLDESGAPVD